MEDRRPGRARMARRWITRAAALAVPLLAVVPASAATAAPLVAVDDAALTRTADGATVTARITWNRDAARADPDRMVVGDVRVVAVSDRGHHPRLLATATYDRIDDDPTQTVRLPIAGDDDLAAIRPGNRVVLTASQHAPVSDAARTERTFVTVAQLQPFGIPQDRIGRRDCSDRPIVPRARLERCDLVGAFLDRALVSVRTPSPGTRLMLADLTGATLRGADLTGASIAGGRVNGADATEAILDNVSLAGAEGAGFIARDATSDARGISAGADIFDARMIDADFRGATLNGVSLNHSRFDGATFAGATWQGVNAAGASFRDADLHGLTARGPSVYFADFTDADLQGAGVTDADLLWATLCRTAMPDGPPAREDRDCRATVDPGPTPARDPFVRVDGRLDREPARERGGRRAARDADDGPATRRAGRRAARGDGSATLRARIDDRQPAATVGATIRWHAASFGPGAAGMSAGDIRVVAIDGTTGLPTRIASATLDRLPGDATTTYRVTITDPRKLAALQRGNRVVLTATQHAPRPDSTRVRTHRSYVAVDTLQAGPGRGRVGSLDCSDRPITADAAGGRGYDRCDLPGAALAQADLGGSFLKADLTGAELTDAGLDATRFDGAALGGVDAQGASFRAVSLFQAHAPRLTMPETLISSGALRAASLDEADFRGATISDTTFATASMRRARFTGATLDKVDLGFGRLAGARLDRVTATAQDVRASRRTTLFLADLTSATLRASTWDPDEAGEIPWAWATLCRTTMPDGAVVDDDCPR